MPAPVHLDPPSDPPGLPREALRRLAALARHPLAPAALVVGAVAAAYANSLGVPFAYDDRPSIALRPALQDLATLDLSRLLASNRGLVDLTFALNLAAGGLDVLGFHLVNVAIHAGAALLVQALALRLLSSPFVAAGADPVELRRRARGPALAAALAFALHPVQVQAVTYVVQRYASLATLCALAAVVLYLDWRRAPASPRGATRLGGALLATLLAMRSKEIAFTLPVVLAGVELLFLDGPPRRRLLGLAPFLLTLAIIPATVLLTGGDLAAPGGQDAFAARSSRAGVVSRWDYLLTQPGVVLGYLRLLALPTGLTFDHDVPVQHDPLAFAVAAPVLLLAAMAAAGVALVVRSSRGDRRLRVAGFGVLWFFTTLSVESSVIPFDDLMFDHRLYLPSVGLALAVATALALALDRLAPGATGRRLLAGGTAAWLVALGAGTVARNATWADPVALLEDGVAKAPGKARARMTLAVAYGERGRIAEALREYRIVLQLAPGDALLHYNLGNFYLGLGRREDAIREFLTLARLLPEASRPRSTLGHLLLEAGRLDEAEAAFRDALARDPGFTEALVGLDKVLRLKGARR